MWSKSFWFIFVGRIGFTGTHCFVVKYNRSRIYQTRRKDPAKRKWRLWKQRATSKGMKRRCMAFLDWNEICFFRTRHERCWVDEKGIT